MRKNYFLRNLKLAGLLLLVTFSAFSQNYEDGIFVLGEGGAGSGNAWVSFVSNDNVLHNNIYDEANNAMNALGDTAQSMYINGDTAYIILNISNSIKIADALTMVQQDVIDTGLINPRYMAVFNGKGYVTCWGSGMSVVDDYVAVINLADNTIEANIPLDNGVERILVNNGKLYVAHMGAYGWGNTVSVIDPATNTVTDTIEVGDVPNSMVVKDGFLYVMCSGKPSWSGDESAGELVKIDLADNSVVSSIDFPSFPMIHPMNLRAGEGDTFYYSVDADVFETTFSAITLPAEPLFSIEEQGAYGIYGMDVIDGKIFVADAGDYTSPGKAYIFSTEGDLLENFTVGIIPNGFYKALDSELDMDHNTLASHYTIYPNPATDLFYIATDALVSVTIFDMSGRKVRTQTNAQSGVSVSGLTAGIYLIEIASDKGKKVQRIIVK